MIFSCFAVFNSNQKTFHQMVLLVNQSMSEWHNMNIILCPVKLLDYDRFEDKIFFLHYACLKRSVDLYTECVKL